MNMATEHHRTAGACSCMKLCRHTEPLVQLVSPKQCNMKDELVLPRALQASRFGLQQHRPDECRCSADQMSLSVAADGTDWHS